MTPSDMRELGKQDGYCGLLVRFPTKPEYMAGYNRGFAIAQKEWDMGQDDREYPPGTSDANFDYNYA